MKLGDSGNEIITKGMFLCTWASNVVRMVMKRDISGNEFMTRYAILLHMACNTHQMVMKWCIIGNEFITVGMDLAHLVIQTQVSGRCFMTMCTISKCAFVHICPCRHDNVNCLQWWPLFLLRLLKICLHGGVKRLVSDCVPPRAMCLGWSSP